MMPAADGTPVYVQIGVERFLAVMEGSVEAETVIRSLDPRWSEEKRTTSTYVLFRLDDGRLIPSFLAESWTYEMNAKKYSVFLTGSGADSGSRIRTIEAVRSWAGIGFLEAIALVDGFPKLLAEGLPRTDAEDLWRRVIEAGGCAVIKETGA